MDQRAVSIKEVKEVVKKKIEMLGFKELDHAAECLKVMAHPVRLRIVDVLTQGEFAVHEIAELCKTSPNQTCEHLRLLKGHKLLSSERRGRTVYYKIASKQLPALLGCIKKSCGKK